MGKLLVLFCCHWVLRAKMLERGPNRRRDRSLNSLNNETTRNVALLPKNNTGFLSGPIRPGPKLT